MRRVIGPISAFALVSIAVSLVSGCVSIPKDALTLTEQSLQFRRMQTRRFETENEGKILAACAGLLQDMGFQIDESETKLGVIVGSKKRSAVNAGEQVAALVIAVWTGTPVPTAKEQVMRASVVTRPVGDSGDFVAVRVTFQRIVWNTQGQVTLRQGLNEPDIYQEFFDKLSKAMFLEAHEL